MTTLKFDELQSWEKQIIAEIIEKINPDDKVKKDYGFLMKRAMTELINTLIFQKNIKITY